MTRKTMTQKTIAALTKPGFHRYPLTVGLYLQVTRSKKTGSVARSWAYRFQSPVTGEERWMGLGPCDLVSLAEARQLATENRRKVRLEKIDPIEERRAEQQRIARERASSMTFAQCVDQYMAQRTSGFTNDKHRKQLRSTLDRASKAFGQLDVKLVNTAMINKLLLPIWKKTPETGSRLRGRIEKVLDWATVSEFRQGENPARWKGHLEHVLTRKTSVKQHHPAMPWADVPAFVQLLRDRDSISARALEFTILTAARTGETIGARWEEFDLDAKVWTVPAERMKAKQEHQVPLSDRAVAILKGIERKGELVFPLSNMAMTQSLRKAGGNGFTVHGFRSAFRDWAGERSGFSRDVIEFALAHKLKDKVERSYYRSNQLPKRTKLMQSWAQFCAQTTQGDTVVQFGVAS